MGTLHLDGRKSNARPSFSGRELKDIGIRRAAEGNPVAVLQTQVALLQAIVRNGRAWIDDATEDEQLAGKFLHRGWRGAAVAGLIASNLIRSVGWVPSARRHRHGGFNRQFEAVSVPRAIAAIKSLKAELKHLKAMGGVA